MLSTCQNISILLPGSIPFGFKMQGGREYRAPLTILSVSSGGKAHLQGLKTGDVLMEINATLTHNLDHTTAMKHIKSAKEGLQLVLTRGTMTHEAGLQAMKEYSESHGDESRDQQAPVRADSVSGIPPPVRADSVSGLPPPPLSQYDLPPPPLLDEIVDLPPPPPEVTPPPPPAPPTPPSTTTPSPPAIVGTPPSKPSRKTSVSRVSPPQGGPPTPPGTPPVLDTSYRTEVVEMPKSNLSKFGSEVTEIAANKESGALFEPKRETLDSWLAKLAAGDPSADNPKPSTNKVGGPKSPTESSTEDPVTGKPTNNGGGETITSLKPSESVGGVSPGGGVVGGFSLASMTYNRGTPPAKSPQMPRSPTPLRLVAPSSLTANSQDIKKKFDSVDLNENKFKNKGSFYNRFPASPESPSPPPSIPSSQITPETTPSKPAAAPSPVQPWVKPAASTSGAKSSVSTPDPVPLVDNNSTPSTPSNPTPSSRITNMLNNKSPTFNSPDRSYTKPSSPKSSYPKTPSPNITPTNSNITPVSSNITPNSNVTVTPPKGMGPSSASQPSPRAPGPVSQGSATEDESPVTPRSTTNGGVGGGKPLFPTKPILLPICKACHQEIRGAYVGAQGRAWHAEHFKCCNCSGDLSQGFKEVEDQLFCGPCYFDKFGEKCVNCGQPVAGPVIQALGNSYHPEHFTCAKCNKVLTDGFNVDNGQPYCNTCHTTFLPDCAGCGEKIEGAAKWISALDQDWHNGCFTCHVCRAPLAGKTFFHELGKALCQLHANAAVNKA